MDNKNYINPVQPTPSVADSKSNNGGPQTEQQFGSWVPVDSGTLGFQINAAPGQEVIGPDGNKYCVKEAPEQLSPVASNRMNAIPTPSSIVQMPPIVQPIALVPYTSQNQPLLQYDPYSKPVDPKRPAKTPSYKRKAYRGISLAAMLLAIAGIVAMLFLAVGVFKGNDIRAAYRATGIDLFKAVLIICGLDASSSYYAERIDANLTQIPQDVLSTLVVYALPIFAVIMAIILFVLVIVYLYKLSAGKTPRHFSVGALINIVLSISIIAILLGMSNGEVLTSQRGDNVKDFFMFQSGIYTGVGLIISFVISVLLLILPFFAKKNAYVLDKEDPALKTYIIED
ncbi:MAG: hypothetical protein PHI19_01365 [Clostridia bacterium]|nr:hypothetical protein [Clostridia bacterium]